MAKPRKKGGIAGVSIEGTLKSDAAKVDLTVVRVGLRDKPESIRKIKRNKMKPCFINKYFDCDAEFLQVRALPPPCVSVN